MLFFENVFFFENPQKRKPSPVGTRCQPQADGLGVFKPIYAHFMRAIRESPLRSVYSWWRL